MNDPKNFPTGDQECQCCKAPTAARQRQNTAYCDDELNWVVLCPECAAQNADHWDEQWKEYRSSQGV